MSARPELPQGTSDLNILEKGEPRPARTQRTSDLNTFENGEQRGAMSKRFTDADDLKEAKKERDQKRVERLNNDLNLILVIVGLLSAVITTFMVYIQPQLVPNSSDEAAALLRVLVYNANHSAFSTPPEIPTTPDVPRYLLTSEYILYIALLTALTSGGYALVIRLASALYSWGPFLWIFDKFSGFVIWVTIFMLFCAFGLLGIAVTLQLLVITPIGISAIKKGTIG